MTDEERANRTTVESLLAAYNDAASGGLSADETLAATLEVLDQFYAPEFDWVEVPTPFFPMGRSGGRAELKAAAELVSSLLGTRRYTLLSLLADADRVAAEYLWEATYREGGAKLRLQMATFYRLRDGQIVEIHEYPCPTGEEAEGGAAG